MHSFFLFVLIFLNFLKISFIKTSTIFGLFLSKHASYPKISMDHYGLVHLGPAKANSSIIGIYCLALLDKTLALSIAVPLPGLGELFAKLSNGLE